MNDEFVGGLIVGVIVTALIWLAGANMTECGKVQSGYLTYRNKTYTVKLYDRLERPARKEPNDVDMD